MFKNLPNYITIFRLILVFVFIFLFSSDIDNKSLYCVITFLIAGLSDVLDGFLARKFKIESNFGKLMDPLADKLMQITVAVCMASMEHSLSWVPVFLILKELVMILGAARLLKKDKIVVQANFFGKLASVIYFLVFLVIMIFENIDPLIKQGLCISFVIVSILAFVNYINAYYKKVKPQ
ncbi:MAG: CDP-diacylglycerol--glycerol-3-phosphate 3-phosphatidyltransferase [Ruminococcaceae bacterium]|nr:CDP-diacylglycerol--glycerol-3-phosphate 3-phosphatidyltransferase [Oscillospiraceae bacterium]